LHDFLRYLESQPTPLDPLAGFWNSEQYQPQWTVNSTSRSEQWTVPAAVNSEQWTVNNW
jgi:hypothetical protein